MKISKLWISLIALPLMACQPETETDAAPAEAPVASAVAPVESSAAVSAPTVETSVVQQAPEAAPSQGAASAQVAPPKVATPVVVKPTPVARPEPVQVTPAQPVAKPAAALPEADALALAKKNGCLACHAIDKKVFGPAWRDVANKYRGDAGAETRLAEKIAKGGGGVWGNTPMPALPKIAETERRALARFVLSLK